VSDPIGRGDLRAGLPASQRGADAGWTDERRRGEGERRRGEGEQARPGGEQEDTVRLTAIRESELSVDEVRAAVAGSGAGGIVLFVGTVRDNDHDHGVTGLSYTAHPSAGAELRRVAEAIAEKFSVLGVAAVHRIGDLAVGDLAVVAAVSAPHRAEAFDACRELIDELKATVPIWKHQRFTDGTDEWVGNP
jgi:molybdopterin synthase catalytic subunit